MEGELSRSTPSPAERWEALGQALEACRAGTLAAFALVDEAAFRRQVHPGYSPLGWHLGHIAYTEALWLVCHAAGRPLPRPELKPVFAVDGRPKHERSDLPPVGEVIDYTDSIRAETLECFDAGSFGAQERLLQFVLQHESQHHETITFLKQLTDPGRAGADAAGLGVSAADAGPEDDMIAVQAGRVTIGNDGPQALDNERPSHRVFVGDFRIARHPTTQAQFRVFIDSGGYGERRWWSAAGWAWRSEQGIEGPLYWRPGCDDHPVSGVSAHEAEAYCRFKGLRLPSEAEWEKAAAWHPEAGRAYPYPWGEAAPASDLCNHDRGAGGTTAVGAHPDGQSPSAGHDFLGNVWEWTSSPFAPYPGFASWPYRGYSAAYFDGKHRVLRGGSWATRPWALRATARNWYTPETREILAGFRCARDGLED